MVRNRGYPWLEDIHDFILFYFYMKSLSMQVILYVLNKSQLHDHEVLMFPLWVKNEKGEGKGGGLELFEYKNRKADNIKWERGNIIIIRID
jgi:hypothetical protein